VCLETVNHSPFGGDYDPDDTGEITCYDPTTYKKISDDRAIRKPENRTQEKPAAQKKESKPKADSNTKRPLPKPAKTIKEAEDRLNEASKKIEEARKNGEPLPESPFSLEDKKAIVAKGLEENILVRVIETEHAYDAGKIGRPRDDGTLTFYCAPLSQVEHGDTDPELLLKAFGTNHDPNKQYTILLMDVEKMAKAGDTTAIIPTFKNLNEMIEANPALGIDPKIAKQVLNDDFAEKFEDFTKAANAKNVDLWGEENWDAAKEFAINELTFDEKTAGLLIERQKIAEEISAWDIFQGNGMSRDTNFAPEKVSGGVEAFIYERKPLDLKKLEKAGAVEEKGVIKEAGAVKRIHIDLPDGILPNPDGVAGYLPTKGSRYDDKIYDFTDEDFVKRHRQIRSDYLKGSKELEKTIAEMHSNGSSSEEIARTVVAERNRQKTEARSLMTKEEVDVLEQGNIEKYGDPVGPSIDDLYKKYKTWDDVIDASMRKDNAINLLLGIKKDTKG
ncbi:MAG: hypothetical protein D6B27_13025, partial [Gammaproteobacteria bacterium]